jgi:hypothetical protein
MSKVGGQGVLPLSCFPLWGREGVTLTNAREIPEHLKKNEFYRTKIMIVDGV